MKNNDGKNINNQSMSKFDSDQNMTKFPYSTHLSDACKLSY
ncbi:hypothetical protein J671_1556 [Acinetobacter sp. 1130196]|nr:hypothetical protein J671_1556 [Acinetobacter sp. 1130196]